MGGAAEDLRAAYQGAPPNTPVPDEAQPWVLDPARADFKRRIPKPFDDGLKPVSGRESIEATVTPVLLDGSTLTPRPSAMTVAHPTHAQRLLLSWAREPGWVLVGIEQAPDWELAGGMLPVPEAHLDSFLPVLAALGVPLKDAREVSHAPSFRGLAPAPPGTTGVGSPHEPVAWAPPGDAEPQRRRARPPRRRGLAPAGPPDDGAHPPADPGEPMAGAP